jgi:hypothetical protein
MVLLLNLLPATVSQRYLEAVNNLLTCIKLMYSIIILL